jgi:methanogenic corrinoid protein MtbC1
MPYKPMLTTPTPLPQLTAFVEALLAMDRLAVQQLLAAPADPERRLRAIEQLVVPALEQVGAQWEQGELSLAQVYMSGRICEELVEELLPPSPAERISQPNIALTVLEDFHLLGKRMLAATLRAGGYLFHDYGQADVATLVDKIVADQIEVLLISVLMLPSALRVRELRRQLDLVGRRPYIIVGGAPFRFDVQLWQEVGADAMGRSASDALALLATLRRKAEPH